MLNVLAEERFCKRAQNMIFRMSNLEVHWRACYFCFFLRLRLRALPQDSLSRPVRQGRTGRNAKRVSDTVWCNQHNTQTAAWVSPSIYYGRLSKTVFANLASSPHLFITQNGSKALSISRTNRKTRVQPNRCPNPQTQGKFQG